MAERLTPPCTTYKYIMKPKTKFPDLTTAMDALEQTVAHAGAIHTAAADMIDLIEKHPHNKDNDKMHVLLDTVSIGQEAFAAYRNLKSLIHHN